MKGWSNNKLMQFRDSEGKSSEEYKQFTVRLTEDEFSLVRRTLSRFAGEGWSAKLIALCNNAGKAKAAAAGR